MLAYHREAVEILHPYVLDLDSICVYSSQVRIYTSIDYTIYYIYQYMYVYVYVNAGDATF